MLKYKIIMMGGQYRKNIIQELLNQLIVKLIKSKKQPINKVNPRAISHPSKVQLNKIPKNFTYSKGNPKI